MELFGAQGVYHKSWAAAARYPSQLGRVSAAQIVIKFNADTKTQLSNWLGFHLQLNYHSISNNHSALYLNKSKHFVTRYVSIAYCLWQNLDKAQ